MDRGAKLVRVLSGDPNPKGPGLRFLEFSSIFTGNFQDAARKSISGRMELSITDRRDRVTPPAPGHLSVARPLPKQTSAVFVEQGDDRHIVVGVGSAGATAELKWPNGSAQLETGQPLLRDRCYRLWLSADPASGRVVLGQSLLDWPDKAHATAIARGIELPDASVVMFAARNTNVPHAHFNGKLEAPAILAGFIEAWSDVLSTRPKRRWSLPGTSLSRSALSLSSIPGATGVMVAW